MLFEQVKMLIYYMPQVDSGEYHVEFPISEISDFYMERRPLCDFSFLTNSENISRSSIFECEAIVDILKDEGILDEERFSFFYKQAEELSKMIYGMINSLSI